MVPGSFHKLTEEYPVLTKLTYVYNMYIHYKVRYVSDYRTLPVVHNFIVYNY